MIYHYIAAGLTGFGIAISFYYCYVTGISPVSSTRPSRRKILGMVDPDENGTIYELGAGWGALAFPLARKCPGAQVVAYELSPVPWLFMKLRWFVTRPANLKIERCNFLDRSLANAALLICYLHTEMLQRLAEKLEDEGEHGALLISNTFEVPGWLPTAVLPVEDLMCPEIYVYSVTEILAEVQGVAEIVSRIAGG